MSYRVGWGENARHFAVVVQTARDAAKAAASMQRYCQDGVVIVNDKIGVVPISSLRHLISVEEQSAVAAPDPTSDGREPKLLNTETTLP